ncbi:hypothetical protein [Nitrincola nitratireducens]|uniref:Uncharacterized protein n=1 Tax=Nitrincola nitratireducens TaxID=1229521 RepID=W9UW15_9GAMM|nr:hypothetical protein [Nitrincola nitratireducens]EXJ11274.1 hypothetical protein D791_01729 [Nitrincola nitratireducens]
MNKKILIVLVMGLLIVLSGMLWNITRDHSIRKVEMEYEEFKVLAEQHFDTIYSDIWFSPPSTDFFQEIRQNPSGWSFLVRQLVADPSVALGVKAGASAAMLDLPPDQLAEFLEFLLTLAYSDQNIMRIASSVAFNSLRGAQGILPGMLPDGSIFDHSHRPAVRRVLQRMWEHPAFPQTIREGDNDLTDLFRGR